MTDELIAKYGDNVCSHAVEVRLASAVNKHYLPDDSILRNKKILGVFTYNNPNADRKAPASGNNIITDAALRNCYLTLADANKLLISDHPLSDIAITGNDRQHRKIQLNVLTPDKSYLFFADTAVIAANQSVLLHFIYLNC